KEPHRSHLRGSSGSFRQLIGVASTARAGPGICVLGPGGAGRPTILSRKVSIGLPPVGESPRMGGAGLGVLHLGAGDVALLVEEIHVPVGADDFLRPDTGLLSRLVELRRGLPEIPVLPEVVQVALLSLGLLFADLFRHEATSTGERESASI